MVDFEDLTDEQRAAADALDRNVTLTAGAGTGKTTTLTARYVRMLERGIVGDAPADPGGPLLPEEIVTTTFTERAANELKKSVREAITERVADADPAEYAAWREIADGLEDGYVHTLHGFCSRLLREHALSVETIDPGFDTLDESETATLLEDTVATLLETHDDHEAVRTLATRYSRTALQEIVTDLLTERPGGIEWADRWADASREEYLAYVDTELHPVSPELAAERLYDPAFVEAADTLRELIESPPGAVDTGGRAWNLAEGVVDRLRDVPYGDPDPSRTKRDRFASLCTHLTTNGNRYAESYCTAAKTRWKGAEDERARFDAAMLTLLDVLEPEKHRFSASIEADANSFPFVRALARLTQIAHGAYTERKRRQNVVDFTDQIEFALEFLKEEATSQLRADLRDRFAYVMVDEFQDTDPRQWEIIAYLTAEHPKHFDARNVFVVGDVKQSIYRFRNADVTQFDETARVLEAANPPEPASAVENENGDGDDQLSTNFRTLPAVLEFVNGLFDEVFDPDGEPYEARPQPLSAFRDDPDDVASVEYLAVPTNPEYRAVRFPDDEAFATARPEHDAELEATALAARLTQLFDEPAQVYDGDSDTDDPEARAICPDDVAILLRSRTHLKTYERALEDADVPFTVASGLGFFETPEITALLNLFRALADPDDERALYGALRSPLFGLTDDTLAMLKRDGEPLWKALAATEHDELRDAYDLLSSWREHLGVAPDSTPSLDGSWAAFLTRVVDETGFIASVSADERPQQAVANVEKFREQLRGYSDEGVTSLSTLVRRIERQRSQSAREGEATVQGGGDGVRILTVHDAKGMEFPVVVVPGVGHGFNMRAAVGGGRVEFEAIDDGYAVGLKAPDPDDPFELATTVARESLERRRKAEERAEEKRILYVACTRARDRLLLTGLHELDCDGVPSMTGVKAPDPETPNSWRDVIQSHVLSESTLAALDEQDHVTGTLGEASFTVSLPTPPSDWADGTTVPTPEVELSDTPPGPGRRFWLSPTDLASLVAGFGSLRLDERTNTVFYEAGDEDEPDRDGHGDASHEGLAPTVFGNLVHRLCELRPPRDRWDDVIDVTYAAEEASGALSEGDRERVRTHTERALSYVDGVHSRVEVEQTYDELSVTAELRRGEISGLIDHLVVTPDAYHVVDYKTNEIGAEEVTEKADYYRTQMEAYALALHQQDPERGVTATLYFTTPDVPYELAWSPGELEDLRVESTAWLGSRLEEC